MQALRGAAAAGRQRPPAPRARRRSIIVRASTQDGQMDLFSPSKINLFLRVVRRREDGYHDLASLFHVIDLGDRMAVRLRRPAAATATAMASGGDANNAAPGDRLVCSDPTVPSDGRNLVIKALDLYRRKAYPPGTCPQDLPWFDVDLAKSVPHGAGLGGGSGNAATALWAANELCGRRAADADLLAWSGEIGSDVSVFFGPTGAAYCTGRGEVVEPVAPPPLPLDTPLLLVKPPAGLSTPAIFRALDLGARSTRDPLDLLSAVSAGVSALRDAAVNDLERPAFDRLPALGALKRRLAGAEGDGATGRPFDAVFMSGSGSTIVCVGSDAPPAWLAAEGWRAGAAGEGAPSGRRGGGGGGEHDEAEEGADDEEEAPLFVSPARLIARDLASDGRPLWYSPSASGEAARAAYRAAQQQQQPNAAPMRR